MASWRELPPFDGIIEHDDQVLLLAATGGAKSTLAASMLLHAPSLVALDGKDALKYPRSRTVTLPAFDEDPERFDRALREALRWREHESNRVILRVHPLDIESFAAYNAVFRAIYDRRNTITWIDEITATGATAMRVQPWLRAISTRGRTRGLGLWTCTQAPYGITPPVLRRNASYTIVGPLDPDDAKDIPRPGIEIATTIPRRSGRFIVYRAGERDPYRLFLPIPDALHGWKAP